MDLTRNEATGRIGDWLQTFSGKQLWPLDPRPEEITLADIAHGLSLKTRFNGQARIFYSVAEHSVRCADYLWAKYHDNTLMRVGLFHDAAEAFLPDIPRPLKKMMPEFEEIENRLLEVIFKKFDLPWPMPAEYKEADNAWLMTEALQIMEPECLAKWRNRYEPVAPEIVAKLRLGDDISQPWSFSQAEEMFLLWAWASEKEVR